MRRLIGFELQKTWCRRSFLLSLCALLSINIFFLWYENLGSERRPELASYKLFQSDIAGMSETEKGDFIEKQKQTIDGVVFVQNILALQNSEPGASFARQEIEAHPGLFEAYYDLYESKEYLRYTNSLESESLFLNSLYEEQTKIASYQEYLKSVQEYKNTLGGISVFRNQDENSFSARNIRKSAADYEDLTTEGICWAPSEAIVSTIESTWTDLLLILLSFLFIGSLITEEKQKGLFYITRSTKYGISHSIISKLLALLLHCLASCALFFGANYSFFGLSAGWCDVNARIQSLAPYMESNLPVSISCFLFLSVLTKALVIFGAGAVLTAVCILSENMVPPCLLGAALWAAGWGFYQFIPGASKLSTLKYLNLFGCLKTEGLYGAYLNLDIGGYPLSRTILSWIVTAIVILIGVVLSYAFFLKKLRLQVSCGKKYLLCPFHPHSRLIRHEGYKILITNHALAVLLLFSILIGYHELTQNHTPSVWEQYYQDIMLKLEGEQTQDKDALIASEQTRYQEAFDEIQRIDTAVSSGELNEETGNAMKLKWNGITAFYPTFQRVLQQHQLVRQNGGTYLYDTGYLYLLGVMGDDMLTDFLLLTIGIILAFSHVISIEYQNGMWKILYATGAGRRGIIKRKIAVCLASSAVFTTLPLLCRFICISDAFPIHGLLFSARSIPLFQDWPPLIPAVCLILLKVIVQMISGFVLTMAVLALSGWRRNHMQAVFFGFLFLCLPVILTVLGICSFSLYPLYSYALG